MCKKRRKKCKTTDDGVMEGYVPGFFSGWKKIIFVIFGHSQAKLTNFMSNLNQFSIYMALRVSPSFTQVKLQDNTTNKFKNAIIIIMLFKNLSRK